jgi:hypothetical protein
MHNRGKKLKESGMFVACPRNNHQKLSTLFSTAVDNFISNNYNMLSLNARHCSYISGAEGYQRRRLFSRQIHWAKWVDS